MQALTKRDLVKRISNETGIVQRKVSRIINRMLHHVIDSVAVRQAVELRNFGRLEVRQHKARVGRNPQLPQNIVRIPPRTVVRFRAGKVMKARINDSSSINTKETLSRP